MFVSSEEREGMGNGERDCEQVFTFMIEREQTACKEQRIKSATVSKALEQRSEGDGVRK